MVSPLPPSEMPCGLWQAIMPADLPSINGIADQIHTSLPERPEVFEEKVRLFPEGCRKLVVGGQTVGYGICHPWTLNSIPPLDEFLNCLPQPADCLYIHDVVVMPAARGKNATSLFVDHIKGLAGSLRIGSLALVSVYGTDRFWSKFGFVVIENPKLQQKVASYGPTARYMTATL